MKRADRIYISIGYPLNVRFVDCRSLASDDRLVSGHSYFQEQSAQRSPGSCLRNDLSCQVLFSTEEAQRRTTTVTQIGASGV